MSRAVPSLPKVQPRSRRQWRAWLQKNHDRSSGILLVFAKKHTGEPTVTYNEAVEEALCYGWVDSTKYPLDANFYMHVFTPRTSKSIWSALNRERAARMIEQKLMTAAGLKAIDVAKHSGAWTGRAAAETLTVPPELQKALNANAAAKNGWLALTPAQRKMFLYYVHDAKRAETRAARVASVIERMVLRGARR